MAAQHAPDQLLTPADVAALAFVDPKTVSRWARAGKIPFETTPGGHRRFRRSDVEALLHQVRDHLPLEPALATPGARRAEDANAPAARGIRSAAADAVVAEAVAIAMDAHAEAAAIEAAQARALAAAEAARVVAHEAAAAAADMRSRATVQAERLAEAATYAQTLVSASDTDTDTDTDEHAIHAALQMAATVDAAAESASTDTAEAAERVAQAVTDAAARVAERVADFERTLEREAPSTALALLKSTLETARHAAQDNSAARRSAPATYLRLLPAAAIGSPPGTADAAAAVVADAVAAALEAEVEFAAEQVLEIATAMVIAAETAAEAAAKARSTRALAVAEAARIVAHDAACTATALGERAEASAAFFAEEVKQALEAVASRESRDRDSGATLLAMRLLTTMLSLAHASARDAESAAAVAADAVAAAAAQLAAAESAIDLAVEAEVSDAADALRGVNLAAARRVAGTTHVRAADAAIRVEQPTNVDDHEEDLLAVASHEMRAPLTSIAAYAEILRSEGGLTLEQTGFVDAIVRNAARLDVLTDDLLLLAGASSPLPQEELGEVDLRSVVASAEEVIATLQLRKHLQVSIELPSDPALVTGDAHQLERVVINLMSNAVKFTENRGTVICRVSSTQADVVMAVVDTGIGIPQDEQGRLFHRFFRGAGARGRAIRGTGLGLHIAATIVANHGGDISVDSVAGQGSVFTVRLPRRTMDG